MQVANSIYRALKVSTLVLGLGALAACAATFRNHGYVPSEEELSEITVGVDTRDTVSEAIGSPSVAGMLSDGGYYYVRSRVRHYAYQAPQVIDRQVVAVNFTDAGVVSNVGRYTLEDGKVVPLSRRITRNTDGEISFIKRLLSNVGKFSAGDFIN